MVENCYFGFCVLAVSASMIFLICSEGVANNTKNIYRGHFILTDISNRLLNINKESLAQASTRQKRNAVWTVG